MCLCVCVGSMLQQSSLDIQLHQHTDILRDYHWISIICRWFVQRFSPLSSGISHNFSYDVPMIFPWKPRFFPCFSHENLVFSYDFPMRTSLFPWFSPPNLFPRKKIKQPPRFHDGLHRRRHLRGVGHSRLPLARQRICRASLGFFPKGSAGWWWENHEWNNIWMIRY